MTLFFPFLLLAAVKSHPLSERTPPQVMIDPLYIVPPEAAKLIGSWVRQFRRDGLKNGIIERPDETNPTEYAEDLLGAYSVLQTYSVLVRSPKTPAHDRMQMSKKILRNAEHARWMTLYLALTLDEYEFRASDWAADFEKWRLAAANYVETHFGDAKTGELPKASQPQHHGIPGLSRK